VSEDAGGQAQVAVGVDIGGTFTDFVVIEGGRLRIHKVPSTPADPSEAFLTGLEALDVPTLAAGVRYVHGSTVATNALLERRGARAALLTTDGFRDVLELARQTRTGLYALTPTRPEPLIPRERSFEVAERVGKEGEILTPLDEAALERTLDAIAAAGTESLAVVFLFSFANPEHERRAGERARRRGLSVSLSSEIHPEYREYERASTTAANACVAPLMDRYLGRLEERLADRHRGAARLQIMQSNGGVISAETARREAVRTVLSGPAGGVVGATHVARLSGFVRILGFDMGGTSTDVALVEGEPATSSEGTIAGVPVRTPMLEIHTVGAGGGSLVRLDAGCGLRVGPESAGADPGPAAYGKGTEPTVTDANLVLGRLLPSAFLGGRMSLDPDRSRAALVPLADQLGLSVEELAEGVVRVANVQMARALRRVSVERGHDPRRFCLVAFGGGGPLHACDLAEETGIPTVLIPRHPGILSALGMLLSDLRKEYSRTVMLQVDDDLGRLAPVWKDLETRAAAEMAAEGVPPEQTRLARELDMRYRGQSYELRVPFPGPSVEAVSAAYDKAHLQRYGFATEGAPCEIVNLRLVAVGSAEKPALPFAEPEEREAPPCLQQRVRAEGRWTECRVIDRDALLPGHRLAGPSLLFQADTTTWLPPGWHGEVDGWGSLILRR
jgi:N-methylhydantoinase A